VSQGGQLIRRRIVIAAAALGAALLMVAPIGARATDCVVKQILCQPTPTPTPSPSPSRSPAPKPKPSSSPSSHPGSRSVSGSGSSAPTGPAATPYTGLRPVITFVLDTAGTARNTQHLLDLLARLDATTQLSQQQLSRGFGHFPVLGYVWYQNDYGAPRYVPYFHLHEGDDLFATAGTPVGACVDGVVAKLANGSIGGISFWLAGDDGITYYYGHLRGYAPGVVAGTRVKMGDVLGYVGDTGSALGTSPHLHFEMHPGGGPPVSPKAVLDGWLNDAERGAVDAYQRIVEYNALNRVGAAQWQSVFDLMREPAAPLLPLLQTALDPSASSFGVEVAFDDLAWSVDAQSLPASSAYGDEVAAPLIDVTQGPPLLRTAAGSPLAAAIAAAR
jgi:murein DD-endopeptidase MepM/ murein hydrolase activator NlpD